MPKKRRKPQEPQATGPAAGGITGAVFTLKPFVLKDGSCLIKEWLRSIRDTQTRQRIQVRLDRIERGNMGDCKPVGEGVSKLRLDFGAGYRVYYALAGATLVILLGGGDKSTQASDIKAAQALWKDHKNDTDKHR